MSERAILLRPIVSEKSYGLMDAGTYVFVVDKRANKIEIRDAVQESFGVRVASVNTMNRKGKRKRQGGPRPTASGPTPSARSSASWATTASSSSKAEDDTMALRKRKPTSPGRRFQSSSRLQGDHEGAA